MSLPDAVWQDAGVPVGRRVPIQRDSHDIAIATESTLIEILAELKKLNAAIGATGSISSVELTVDSKAVVKPTVKIYDLDAAAACEMAEDLFDDLIIKYGAKPT